MEKVKVGVVGLGMMGTFHAKVYGDLSGVELIGGVDALPEAEEKFNAELNVKKIGSLDALLDTADAVSICTPDHLHKDAALKAFDKNVKCLIEKPLATSSADCGAILSARPDPSYLMVGHILRFDPRLWHARRTVMSGAIGKVISVKIWRNNDRAGGEHFGRNTSSAWFLGVHDIDAVHFVTGERVVKVSAIGKKFFTPHYDYVAASLELTNGALVTMENGFIIPRERVSALDAGMVIIGEHGMVELDMNHSGVRLTTAETGRSLMQDTYHWPLLGEQIHGDLRAELEAFIDAVKNNETPPVTGEDGAEAVKVIERITAFLDAGN